MGGHLPRARFVLEVAIPTQVLFSFSLVLGHHPFDPSGFIQLLTSTPGRKNLSEAVYGYLDQWVSTEILPGGDIWSMPRNISGFHSWECGGKYIIVT